MNRALRFRSAAALLALFALTASAADSASVQTDVEIWNAGVDSYRAGDVTNALRVLRPLMLSKTHGARAAEVVAKIEYDRGELEEAAAAAQIALRASPDDARANRNFTRASDRLPEMREARRIETALKQAQGKDPGALMQAATLEARHLLKESATYLTNSATRAVALSDALSARAVHLVDAWLPLRETIAQSVTNEEQAATIIEQLNQAQAKTKQAARELSDMNNGAYSTLAAAETDFTRFYKMTVLPPSALDEDLVAQSNAWADVETVNNRAWQHEALDFTRAFRAKFPAWARAYEQQAQADTNKPPFTAEDQAKVSALATELEKVQLECVDKALPPQQEKALDIIRKMKELMPKDKSGGNNQRQQNQNQPNQDNQKKQDQQENRQDDQNQQQDQKAPEQGEQQPEEQESEPDAQDGQQDESEDATDRDVESVLKKAQERNDEHEADKKIRMRKMQLPPNERDW